MFPEELKHKPFVLIATIQVKPGKEERLLELLKAVSISANSKNEPGCLTYRLTRKVDGSQVIVYEEYVNEQALLAHREQESYKALFKARAEEDLTGDISIEILEEVKV